MVLAIAVGIGASMTTLTVVHLLSGNPHAHKSGKLFFPQVDPESPVRTADAALSDDGLPFGGGPVECTSGRSPGADRQQPGEAAGTGREPAAADGACCRPPPISSRCSRCHSATGTAGARRTMRAARVAVISVGPQQQAVRRQEQRRPHAAHPRNRRAHRRRAGALAAVAAVLRPLGARTSARPRTCSCRSAAASEFNKGNFHLYTCWHVPKDMHDLQNADCVWVWLWVQLDSPAKVRAYRTFVDRLCRPAEGTGSFRRRPRTCTLRDLMTWLDFHGMVPDDVRLQAWLAFGLPGHLPVQCRGPAAGEIPAPQRRDRRAARAGCQSRGGLRAVPGRGRRDRPAGRLARLAADASRPVAGATAAGGLRRTWCTWTLPCSSPRSRWRSLRACWPGRCLRCVPAAWRRAGN